MVRVCYNHDTTKYHIGKIVRDDVEELGLAIIKLVNGRILLDTECQYSMIE